MFKNRSRTTEWSLLPQNREVIYSIPPEEIANFSAVPLASFFAHKKVISGELVDISNKGALLEKGNAICVLVVPAQNIFATRFGAKKSSQSEIDKLYLQKNAFKAAEAMQKLMSAELASPRQSINNNNINEVIFTGQPNLLLRSGMFRTNPIDAKEIIFAANTPPAVIAGVKRNNPNNLVYSTNRQTLTGVSNTKSFTNWINNPSQRYILDLSEPLFVTDSDNEFRERFLPFVPEKNMLFLKGLDADDVTGARYQQAQERKTGNARRILGGLTINDHLTLNAHANTQALGRVIHNKKHLFRRADEIADLLHFHGLRNIGVLLFNGCHFGHALMFEKLPRELASRGINFGYMAAAYGKVDALRGEIMGQPPGGGKDAKEIILPFSRAFNVVKGNVSVGYSDFTYHAYRS